MLNLQCSLLIEETDFLFLFFLCIDFIISKATLLVNTQVKFIYKDPIKKIYKELLWDLNGLLISSTHSLSTKWREGSIS